jgi:hypothetical protein
MTAKRLKRPTDLIQRGKLIGDILTGQIEDQEPASKEKNAAAVALGRRGGLIGGRSRAEKMSPEQRTKAAKKAAKARWKKKPQ